MTAGGPPDPESDDTPGRKDDYPIDPLEREAAGLPPLSDDGRARPTPPTLVHAAFLVIAAAAAMLIAGFALMVANQDAIAERMVAAHEQEVRSAMAEGRPVPEVTAGQIAEGVPTVVWSIALGGLMFALLFLLFAYKAREGTRSARTVLAALTAVMLVFAIGMPAEFVNPVMIVAIVAAFAGTFMLFLPAVSGYFPELPRTRRRWQDSG